MLNLPLFTIPYSEILIDIEVYSDADALFYYWFCDKNDDVQGLVERLSEDLAQYNPQQLYFSDRTVEDWQLHRYYHPWFDEISPYADRLSQEQIERAILFLRGDKIPKSYERIFLGEIVRGVDKYVEAAGDNRRYPILLFTPQSTLQMFYEENGLTMPNWQGFRSRQDGIYVVDRGV